MSSGRQLVPGVEDLVCAGIARGHREHDERSGNRRWTADWHIEIPAADPNGKADDETYCEFHSPPPSTKTTLLGASSGDYHAFA
jgi:hypothetical protein